MSDAPLFPVGVHAPDGVDPTALAACMAAAAVRPDGTSMHQFERLAAIARMGLADNLSAGTVATLQRVVEVIDDLLGIRGGVSIILQDPADGSFTTSASTVAGQTAGHSATRVRSGGATRFIVESGHGLYVSELADDPFGANRMLLEAGMRSYVGLPVMARGVAVAVVYAMSDEPASFDAEDIDLLRVVADRAAMALIATQEHERVLRIARHSEALGLATRQVVAALGQTSPVASILGQLAMSVDFDLLALEVPANAPDGLEAVVVGRSPELVEEMRQGGVQAILDRLEPEGRGLRLHVDDFGLDGVSLVAVREREPLDGRDRQTLRTLASILAIPFRARR